MKKTILITILIIGMMTILPGTAISNQIYNTDDSGGFTAMLSSFYADDEPGDFSKMLDIFNLPDNNVDKENLDSSLDTSLMGNLEKINMFENVNTGLGELSELENSEKQIKEYFTESSILDKLTGEISEKFAQIKNIEGAHSNSFTDVNYDDINYNEVIVKFKDDAQIGEILGGGQYLQNNALSKIVSTFITKDEDINNLKVQELFTDMVSKPSKLSNVYSVKLPKYINILDFISECYKSSEVEYAEPNHIYYYSNIPDDPLFVDQWALNNIGQTGGTVDADIDAPEAWDDETGDLDVIIAIVDSGVDYNHEDLAENIWINAGEIPDNGIDDDGNGYVDDVRGWDTLSDDNNPMDTIGHGTHCAGIASAVSNNGNGTAGVCWKCKIMPVKIGEYYITAVSAANGITYAADNGADVISMSWGGFAESQLMQDAIDYAYDDKGVVLVGAAGNDQTYEQIFPGGYEKIIAVSATDHDDCIAGFSNYGFWVDVAAPGVNILSTVPNDGYRQYSGTSMACPHVSGLAALLLSKYGSSDQETIKNCLKTGADKLNSTIDPENPELLSLINTGRINAAKSLEILSDIRVDLDNKLHFSLVSDDESITGTAAGDDFDSYYVYYGAGFDPSSWTLIGSSTTSVTDGTLTMWDTTAVSDGLYSLKLAVLTDYGFYINETVFVTVNNDVDIWHVDQSGGGDFKTIRKAMYYAGDGDTIFVHIGSYSECVTVNRDIKIIGEDKENTLVNQSTSFFGNYYDLAYSYNSVFYINADNVNITNLTISTSYIGIFCDSVDNVQIFNNDFSPHGTIGVNIVLMNSTDTKVIKNRMKSSYETIGIVSTSIPIWLPEYIFQIVSFGHSYGGAVIKDNIIESSAVGIILLSTDQNLIENNIFGGSVVASIILVSSDDNSIIGNTIMTFGIFGGLFVYDAYSNTVTGNLINDKNLVYLEDKSNQIVNNAGQVILVDCSQITVKNLDLNNVTVGIELYDSKNCDIEYNDISYSLIGVCLLSSDDNRIYKNEFYTLIMAIASDSSGHNILENTINQCALGISIVSLDLSLLEFSENEVQLTIAGGVKDNIITDNEMYDVLFGITVVSNSDNTIEGNIIEAELSYYLGAIGIALISLDSLQVSFSLDGELHVLLNSEERINQVNDNIISNFMSGIIIILDSENTIEENIIETASYFGITVLSISLVEIDFTISDLDDTSLEGQAHMLIDGGHGENQINDNTIQNFTYGILVISNEDCTITENIFNNENGNAIMVISLDNILLNSNIAIDYYDIENEILWLDFSIYGGNCTNKIKYNFISPSELGILVVSDGSNYIEHNTLIQPWFGIILISVESINLDVEVLGLELESSFSLYGGGEINKINNNELSESYVGISLYSGSDNIVSNNNFDMVIFGIISASCESITVTPEIIDDDFDMLITATINIGTNDNTIKNNVFDESFIGIATLSGASNIITNNSLVSTGQLQLGILSVSLKSVYFEGDSDMYNSDKDIILFTFGGDNNIIEDNIISDSEIGIVVLSNSENNIINNDLSEIGAIGILFISLESFEGIADLHHDEMEIRTVGGNKHSLIKDNEITNVGYMLSNLSSAIAVVSDSNVTVERNTIGGLTVDNGFDIECESNGILLLPSNIEATMDINTGEIDFDILEGTEKGNIIRSNIIDGNHNGYGITLWYQSNNVICCNFVEDTKIGIYVPEDPIENELKYLPLPITSYGYDESEDNLFYHNNLRDNDVNAFDECINDWDDGEEGNYWDDYTGSDTNGDGIGETSYNIPGGYNVDNYPLVDPYVDDAPPTINIIKPESAFYFRNNLVRSFLFERDPLIIGKIDIGVEASDDSGIDRVVFKIDDEEVASVTTAPYNYTWSTLSFSRHTLNITAYDHFGNSKSAKIEVIKIF